MVDCTQLGLVDQHPGPGDVQGPGLYAMQWQQLNQRQDNECAQEIPCELIQTFGGPFTQLPYFFVSVLYVQFLI